jgi:hypothetical protein
MGMFPAAKQKVSAEGIQDSPTPELPGVTYQVETSTDRGSNGKKLRVCMVFHHFDRRSPFPIRRHGRLLNLLLPRHRHGLLITEY